jgi:hypothetical protein
MAMVSSPVKHGTCTNDNNNQSIITDEQSSLDLGSDVSTVDDTTSTQHQLPSSSSSSDQTNKKKKSSPTNDREIVVKGTDPNHFVGKRVAKYFVEEGGDGDERRLYFGTIDRVYGPKSKFPLWHVSYDDDDEEDFGVNDLQHALILHSKHKGKDYVGRRVAKYFVVEHDQPEVLFFGTVDKASMERANGTFWHVTYDDGDEDDYHIQDIKAGIMLYNRHKKTDARAPAMNSC